MTGKMIIEIVYTEIFCLNYFYPSGTIIVGLTQRTSMKGLSIDYNLHCKNEFGTYVQNHEQNDNSMTESTVGLIVRYQF